MLHPACYLCTLCAVTQSVDPALNNPAPLCLRSAGALDTDTKNYHAWAHRQVVVAASGTWRQEMEYVEQLIQQDVRNNSAWNQRMFVLQVSSIAAASDW